MQQKSQPDPVDTRVCKLCNERKLISRMQNRRCFDCINLSRRERYLKDPAYRLTRTQQRDAGEDISKRQERQARYKLRNKYELLLIIPLNAPLQETVPVKLPNWFWHMLGKRVIPDEFNSQQVKNHSYNTVLAHKILLRRYRGMNLPDVEATLHRIPNYAGVHGETLGVMMLYRDPKTGIKKQVMLNQHPFQIGDRVLVKTKDKFHVPRFVKLQGQLESSLEEKGIQLASCISVDPTFVGNITFKLFFAQEGYLIPDMPLAQLTAQTCLHLSLAKGHSSESSPAPTSISFRRLV